MPQVSDTGKRNPRYYWGRIIAANMAASVIVPTVFSGLTWRTPLRPALVGVGVTFLFSSCIGLLIGLVMPHVAPLIWSRLRFPWTWAAIVGTMVTLAMVGSSVAITVLTAVGYLPPGRFFEWFFGSLKVVTVVTLTIGLFITVYETMETQLREATVALRTKERDEAEARRLAAEAQLASIESRVQPHFLFNTLNSIAALVHDDPAGAERMTGQLASLLRSALDSTATPLVPLDDELQIVRAYLDIERVRFGDRLRYAVDLGDGVAAALVPRMALQTLVENSVKYAVAPRREGGEIHVRAIDVDGRVRVSVDDDGPGFDATVRPEGHGLDLLAERLKMLFGERASLEVDSRPGATSVTIDVPGNGPAKAGHYVR
jgi:two-component system, LytTR family, sensor histidine kinase AlgZ